MHVVGLDIGGANLKAADGRGLSAQVPFPLWKSPDRLVDEVRTILGRFPRPDAIALTMTGELCDCFESKSAGVRHIVAATTSAAGGVPVFVWTLDAKFVRADAIKRDPLSAAAANWLALATFASRHLSASPGLVIDLGSTTCDIIPVANGSPTPIGRTDPERLRSGELVYCGVRRTPLCAVFGLERAAEFFATTADVFVALGDLPENPSTTDTADGRPLTAMFSRARLARMECDENWDAGRALALAEEARLALIARLARGVRLASARLPEPPKGVVISGAGEFLLPAVLDAAGLGEVPIVSLSATLGADLSTAACAHAVAILLSER